MNLSRRQVLSATAAAAALGGLGERSSITRLPRVSAEEAKLDPKLVRLAPEIEPLVRLLENTPRDRLLEEVGQRVRDKKVSYREVLAALLLAGVRNVQPRPVGFKFHTVLVVNSAHLASLASPDEDRWLPIFWALDYFKDAQARDVKEGDWSLGPVDEKSVPPADRAAADLTKSLERWDPDATDVAAAGFARSVKPEQAFELFCRFGARDFRDIGHKAIYVANGYRTLRHIGWQHAEPVLRSLAYALLAHEGDNPADRDADADRPWRKNQERARRMREGWDRGKESADATPAMLKALRDGSPDDACETTIDLLNRGAAPSAIWDAILGGSCELLMRKRGILSLHAVTTANALHFAFQTSTDDATRRLLLLQNAAFVPMFRGIMGKDVPAAPIEQFEPLPTKAAADQRDDVIAEILHDVTNDKPAAAGTLLSDLQHSHDAAPLMHAARRLIFQKGDNPHDYKFSSAVFEDYEHVSPRWRNRFLAASVFMLRGSGDKENVLVKRMRAAVS